MESLRIPGRIALFVAAIVLVVQVSAVKADGGNHHGRVEVTFTKWVLTLGPNPGFFKGFTGGGAEGVFVGETFVNMARTNPVIPSLSYLEVIYGVQANDTAHSFTALIRGGAALGKSQLDGRILAGWKIGAPVHVEWTSFPSPSADCPSPPEFAGPRCFVGTITIGRAEHEDDDDND